MSVLGSAKDSNEASMPDSLSLSDSLLMRLKTGETEAWTRMAHLYEPVVHNWCRRSGLSPHDAAVVCQEVFTFLSQGKHKFEQTAEHNSFTGWLWGITRNKLLAFYKKQQTQPKGVDGSSPLNRLQQLELSTKGEPGSGIVDSLADRKLVLQRSLELLKDDVQPQTWQVFWQVAVEGRAPADVAADFKLNLANIYVIRGRMMRRIREELQDLLD